LQEVGEATDDCERELMGSKEAEVAAPAYLHNTIHAKGEIARF
jgi:hypothetical protein